MAVKASVSLTNEQDAFARELVRSGRFPSLSAVVQHGLEMLRRETELNEAELAALRRVLDGRRRGPFVAVEESRGRTAATLAAERARLAEL